MRLAEVLDDWVGVVVPTGSAMTPQGARRSPGVSPSLRRARRAAFNRRYLRFAGKYGSCSNNIGHGRSGSAPDASQAPQPAQTLEKLLPLGCRFDLLR